MIWNKKGLVFPYTEELMGTKSHCQHACPILLKGDVYRVYFGSRDFDNNTQIYSFDYDLVKNKVTGFTSKLLVGKGKLGHFDQNGIYPSCVIRREDEFWMYTLGFTRGEAPLYYTRIGLAIGDVSSNMFRKHSPAPLLNTSEHDPWMLTGPYVMYDQGRYRMWYVSGEGWQKEDNGIQSYYHIKYAESEDGLHWKREGLISIERIHPGEKNIARPWIIKEGGLYRAWYSYSCGQGYRIGYAESKDGFVFDRKDDLAGIPLSDEAWENEAVAYPAVVSHKGKKYMFYNGNNFGKDGIALAVSDE